MNLRRFVCEQYPQPWNEGRYTYATDSNIAVRVPRRAEYNGNRSGAPNVEYLFRRDHGPGADADIRCASHLPDVRA
jgi:hypothetical protein